MKTIVGMFLGAILCISGCSLMLAVAYKIWSTSTC